MVSITVRIRADGEAASKDFAVLAYKEDGDGDWISLDTASSVLFKELIQGKLPKKSIGELAGDKEFRVNVSSEQFWGACGKEDRADEEASVPTGDLIPDVVAQFARASVEEVARDKSRPTLPSSSVE